jgi:RNA-directed DNA polymerase
METTIQASADEIRAIFPNLKSRADVAKLLEVPLNQLTYHLFKAKKRSGGYREISSPASALKILHGKLAGILQEIYIAKNVVHGFTRNRSIITNAEKHARSQ